jgi:PPOX class probable F420-dependent enzyme
MEFQDALGYARERTKGALVTLKRDGRPQLSNVAYSLGDDDVIRISITATRAKYANARRDPRVSLYVTSDDFWAYVVLEGEADMSPPAESPDDATVEELISLYRQVSGEHPDWDEYRAAMVKDQRLVLRLRPERAYGMA